MGEGPKKNLEQYIIRINFHLLRHTDSSAREGSGGQETDVQHAEFTSEIKQFKEPQLTDVQEKIQLFNF